MSKWEIGSTGQFIEGPEFWALVDRRRDSENRLHYSRGAFRADDGTWYWPDDMSPAERAQVAGSRQSDLWWEEHERDTSVIPELSDSDLKHFRLLADIRADIPVMDAATQELWRRGIRDYPIAI
jgi:hypothetical protein